MRKILILTGFVAMLANGNANAAQPLNDEQMDQVTGGMLYMGYEGGYFPYLANPYATEGIFYFDPLPVFMF